MRSRRPRRSGSLSVASPAAVSAHAIVARGEDDGNFIPSREATIAPGGKEKISFRGDGGAAFGVDHLTVGGDFEGLLVSAATEGGDVRLFGPVHLSALRDLFLRQRLKGLLKVAAQNELAMTLHNPTEEERTVIVQLQGYNGAEAIDEQEQCLAAEHDGEAPAPKLAVARETVPARAEAYEIDVPGRAYPIGFSRFFVGSGADLSDLRVALKLRGGDVVHETVFASQLRDKFLQIEATRPFVVAPRTPLRLAVTNDTDAPADVSVLFEAYRQ